MAILKNFMFTLGVLASLTTGVAVATEAAPNATQSVCQADSLTLSGGQNMIKGLAETDKATACSHGNLQRGEQIAKRGCCSRHGGVCGCSDNGRAICCDDTLSPSCGC